jgi:formate hydrogenlyase subunit 3/multisubunit Na+/H+ antiporter MnhD subunit
MIVTAGVWMSVEKEIKRLMGYCVLVESGFSLLMLSLLANGGVQLLYQSLIPRILALLLVGYSLAIMVSFGMELSLQGIRGGIRKLPFSSIGILIGLFTLAGFPLFPGFPYKLETLNQVGQVSTGSMIWIAVGLAGMVLGMLKVFISLTYPGNEKLKIHETITQVIIICTGSLLLIILGWVPGIISHLIRFIT